MKIATIISSILCAIVILAITYIAKFTVYMVEFWFVYVLITNVFVLGFIIGMGWINEKGE